jgi:hypothetical protein
MPGLVIREGVKPLSISLLTPTHAAELIGRVAGHERVAQEPDAADALTRYCGYLPLAIEVLGRDGSPDVHWTVSRALDLPPDGSTAAVAGDPPEGRLPRGFVPDRWRVAGYRLPVHPATMCLRRNLITALGGWMAVPGSDDTGLLVAASTLTVGYFHAQPGLLYRKWPGQESGQTRHTEPVGWTARMSLIDERARALEQLWAQQSVATS